MIVYLKKTKKAFLFILLKNLSIWSGKLSNFFLEKKQFFSLKQAKIKQNFIDNIFYKGRKLERIDTFIVNNIKNKRVLFESGFSKIQNKFVKFDEVFMCKLKGVFCIPNSNLIFEKTKILVNPNHNCKSYYLSEIHGPNSFLDKKNYSITKVFNLKRKAFGATFFHSCSSNYCHFLLEILPRAIQADKNIPLSVPFFFDQPVFDAFEEALQKMISKKRKIFYTEKNSAIYFKKLFYLSDTCYFPWHFRPKSVLNLKFHPKPFQEIRKLARALKKNYSKKYPKKIFIRRKSKVRSLINQEEIQKHLNARGFTAITPGILNFESQVQVFENASKIVAASGAELANCIFSKPGTEIFILFGNHPDLAFKFWSNLLEPLGIKTFVIKGFSKNKSSGYHSNFSVSPKKILDLVGI